MPSGVVSHSGATVMAGIRPKRSLYGRDWLLALNASRGPNQALVHNCPIRPHEVTQIVRIAHTVPIAMLVSVACRSLTATTKVCTLTKILHDILTLTHPGVGGWLINRDNNGNASTSTFNTTDNDSQISVPIPNVGSDLTPQTFRRRSFGAASTGINSPELLTPSHQRHSNASMLYGRPVPGPASPQSYFNNATAARSTTSINSRRSSRVTVRVESEETPSDAENALM